MFPEINYFLHRPAMSEPPLMMLREVDDGTYSINDLLILHNILDYKDEVNRRMMEQEKQAMERFEQEMSNG